jgi:hypothetical protein
MVVVRLPDELAAALAPEAGEPDLDAAVERVVRAHLAAAAQPVPGVAERAGRAVPFWLSAGDEPKSDIEGELRDRMAQRRTADTEDGEPSPPRRPPGSRGGPPPRE